MAKVNLLSLFFRSFLVQVGFNYERLQALGTCWALSSLLKEFNLDREEKKAYLQRHLLPFNSNPYFSTYALSAIAGKEETSENTEDIIDFKNKIRGPLGSFGDNFIWKNLKPTLILIGIFFSIGWGWKGGLFFWVVFNLFQIYIRARGVIKGYELKENFASDFKSAFYKINLLFLPILGSFLIGFISSRYAIYPKLTWVDLLTLFFSGAFGFFIFKKNISPYWGLSGCLLISLLLSVLKI